VIFSIEEGCGKRLANNAGGRALHSRGLRLIKSSTRDEEYRV
jgi:hypothetical protein